MEKVFMQSPEGEIREVEATPGVVVPLMVAGWKQVQAQAAQKEEGK